LWQGSFFLSSDRESLEEYKAVLSSQEQQNGKVRSCSNKGFMFVANADLNKKGCEN